MGEVKQIATLIANALKPNENINICEYANKYRKLPRGASAEAGQYKSSRTPYLEEVMEWLSPQDPTNEVIVIKGTQLGFTEVANNAIFYYMDIDPTSQMLILPTEELGKDHSKSKLKVSLEAMPHLAKKIKKGKTSDDIGNIYEKEYDGGTFYIKWAGGGANLRSKSVRFVIMDDVDGYGKDVESSEGNVIDLGKRRTDAFGVSKKIYINSTPTIKGKSNIEKEFEESDKRLYYMPCPNCTPKDKELQNKDNMVVFEEEFFEYKYKDYKLTSEVFFKCPHCKAKILEAKKSYMMNRKNGAKTIATASSNKKGLRIPSFYSPVGFLGWSEIFQEKLTALKEFDFNKNQDKLQTWENTRNAKPYDYIMGDMDIDITSLLNRREKYKFEVPNEVIILTAGIDTQDYRLECSVIGYGENETSYHIEHFVLVGDTSQTQVWEQLDNLLLQPFKREKEYIYIYSAGVDLGGHRSKESYNFVKKRMHRRIYGVYGNTLLDDNILKNRMSRDGKKINKYSITVNSIKNVIYSFLQVDKNEDGYVHYPLKKCYNVDYFSQLLAEVRDEDGRWINPKKKRNEALDCFVYSYASLNLGISKQNIDLYDIKPFLEKNNIKFITPIRR
jgi:phage terminase large subunit GpA-like protein